MKKQTFLFLKNNKVILFLILLSTCCYVIFKILVLYKENNISYSKIKNIKFTINVNHMEKIAHAGGIYNNQTYTNSIESLNFNKKKYKYFEIDLYLNKDDELICSHNPEDQFLKLNVFLKKYNYTPCTIETLNEWLDNNPGKIIVTDIKNNNLKALKIIKNKINEYNLKFIPQIYYPEEYEQVKSLGYENIIWTFYRLNNDQKNISYILSKLKNMNLYSVTLSENFVLEGYGIKIKEFNIPIYAHTINTKKKYFFYKYFLGIDSIYTDQLN